LPSAAWESPAHRGVFLVGSAGPVLALGGVVAFFCFCAGFIAAYFVTTKRD
jgi:hypothetical protein